MACAPSLEGLIFPHKFSPAATAGHFSPSPLAGEGRDGGQAGFDQWLTTIIGSKSFAVPLFLDSRHLKAGQSFRPSISFHARTQALVGSKTQKIAASAQHRRSRPTNGLPYMHDPFIEMLRHALSSP